MLTNKEQAEQELIRGCVENNRKSQEQLYRKFFPTMLAMCRKYMSDEDEVMDVLNQGFLKVFQKINLYENRGSLEGWIRRLIFRTLADHFRSKKSYLKFLVMEERDQPLPENAVQSLFYEDLMSLVKLLPTTSKEVFLLHALEGYTHIEIGEKLGMSEGTSKWHLSNARKILKEKINDYAQQRPYTGRTK